MQRKRKTLLLFLCFPTLLLASCSTGNPTLGGAKKVVQYVTGESVMTTNSDDHSTGERRKLALSGFDGFDLKGAVDVHFTQGSDYKVEYVDNDNILERAEVKGGKLVISTKNHLKGNVRHVDFYVTSPAITSIKVSGVSVFKAENIASSDMKISVSGVGTITFGSLQCASLQINESGVGKIKGRVKAETVKMTVTGVVKDELDIEASHLEVSNSGASTLDIRYRGKTADIGNSGTGKIAITVDCDELKARNSGVAKLSIAGTADKSDIHSSGVSKVDVSRLNNY
ncbi:MAG: DUF2807 domain-containing protein [Prevotella sp.]|nr:DUF2807 domain-containing protein [Prevotella sp.]